MNLIYLLLRKEIRWAIKKRSNKRTEMNDKRTLKNDKEMWIKGNNFKTDIQQKWWDKGMEITLIKKNLDNYSIFNIAGIRNMTQAGFEFDS